MEVKDRIRGKAEELFKRFGIRTITMDEIANQLGVSKKTIYQYYADKDALVDAVIEEEIARSEEDCMKGFHEARNAIDEIFIVMEQVERTFSDINPTVFYDLERFHFSAFQRFKVFKEQFLLNMISSNLRRGIAEELYRPELEVDIISRYRMGFCMGMVFDQELFPISKYNIAKLQKEILEHFLYGVVSLKGYKLILKYKSERTKKSTHNEPTYEAKP